MIRASAHSPTGEHVDTLTLDHAGRHRRRMSLVTDGGLAFLLDLPEAYQLRHGDRLVLDDGRRILVQAASEHVTEVRAADAAVLARLAWHLGNRHTPIQVLPGILRLRRDPVLAEMLRGLGGEVLDVEAPFDPEAGAYAGPPTHGPGHHA